MIPILPGNYYHVYNRSISGSLLFYYENNYEYFLRKLKEYLHKEVNILSYCLLSNHFHLLIKVKEEIKEINYSKLFSNFFNCYTKSINKEQNRHGSLFVKPFKRKLIEKEDYLRVMVNYIHRNPIHHKVTDNIIDYKWSSYRSILSKDNYILDIDGILNIFNDIDTFELYVNRAINDYKDLNLE